MSHHPPPTREPGRERRALLAALTTVLCLAVALLTAQTGAQAATAATSSAAAKAEAKPKPYEDASLPIGQRVRDLLSRMTLKEKIGQMTQAERDDVAADPSAITTLKLGSVLSGGGSVPAVNTPTGWADMVDDYQDQALATRLHIPIIYGVDSVHGHGNLKGATVFPHNIGLGATRDPRLVKKIADITAQETRASGPQWAFAPCICVARDDRWGRTYESYGEDPKLVEKMETSIDGLQGGNGNKIDRFHVLASAKHFAGDGLTAYGTPTGDYKLDQGIDQVSRAEFDKLALAPYWPAVLKHNVGSVMPSFSSVDWTEDGLGNPVKMSANKELLTQVLKKSMRFHGFVISDWQAIHQLPGTELEKVVTSRQRRHRHVHGARQRHHPDGGEDLRGQPPGGREHRPGEDDPDRRRGEADPDREVQARPVRAPLHRPQPDRPGRQRGAPQGRPHGRPGVTGAVEEQPRDAAAQARQGGVRRGQQRRQHRQPGRWLDAHLAGRLDQRDPGPDGPRRHQGAGEPRDVQPGRSGAGPGRGERHRGGRRDAVRRGLR